MNEPSDALLGRIRKLLAKAEDPACTPAEAEALTGKAAELIAKYGVDRAMLADTSPEADPIGDRTVRLDAPYARDKADLLATVAVALRCKVVQRVRRIDGGREVSLHLFGHASDLDRVELLFTSLLVQAAHALAKESVPSWESAAAYRRSWYAGYSTAIGRRLRLAEARAQSTADEQAAAPPGRSVALVLADRSALVAHAVEQAYPHLRPGRSRHLSGSGQRSGYAAGQRADLGTTSLRTRGSSAPAIGVSA